MPFKYIAAAVFTVTLLSGCLDNDLERGAAGAAVGAVVAKSTGGDLLTGAAIGGAAGALCDDVNICN
ncbi:hypothetical protein [Halocynthiibacter namhaensis]|uniref:hypothetical protein n=1 Tax=Halocynthiibacter namhaensis TaxID=1290553 RepID=UPI00057967CC|nr:hypothetical protein [Halocynthiibacter namhaensis]